MAKARMPRGTRSRSGLKEPTKGKAGRNQGPKRRRKAAALGNSAAPLGLLDQPMEERL